jgi:hypothetical protein
LAAFFGTGALSACAGGSAGVASTQGTFGSASYTKLAEMTGDRTFQSGGIRAANSNGILTGQDSQAYGSGVVISYTAASGSYTLTAPDGTTATFSSNSGTPPPPPPLTPPSPPNTQTFYSGSDRLILTSPTVSGVALSYTFLGEWTHTENGVGQTYVAVAGVPTVAGDMPKSGTANYQTSIDGSAQRCSNCTTKYGLAPNSTATFSANFGAGTVATTLNLVGTAGNQVPFAFGSYSGTGTNSSSGPRFSGRLTSDPSNPNSATGAFSGAFFGPQAKEMGYAWYLTGLNILAHGVVTGTK